MSTALGYFVSDGFIWSDLDIQLEDSKSLVLPIEEWQAFDPHEASSPIPLESMPLLTPVTAGALPLRSASSSCLRVSPREDTLDRAVSAAIAAAATLPKHAEEPMPDNTPNKGELRNFADTMATFAAAVAPSKMCCAGGGAGSNTEACFSIGLHADSAYHNVDQNANWWQEIAVASPQRRNSRENPCNLAEQLLSQSSASGVCSSRTSLLPVEKENGRLQHNVLQEEVI
jgi:hypothetical protein